VVAELVVVDPPVVLVVEPPWSRCSAEQPFLSTAAPALVPGQRSRSLKTPSRSSSPFGSTGAGGLGSWVGSDSDAPPHAAIVIGKRSNEAKPRVERFMDVSSVSRRVRFASEGPSLALEPSRPAPTRRPLEQRRCQP